MSGEPWLEIIAELQRQNALLLEENALLRAENERLKKELEAALARIEELEREVKRQTAPFRKDEDQKVPPEKRKKPGRKKGHRGARRPRPPQVDAEVVVDLPCCPHCHGPVEDRKPITQYIEELPVMRPEVTRLVTFQGTCPCCGEVHSSHPLQTSFAIGAAGIMLGPQAMANIVLLKTIGLTGSKICRVLGSLFHLKLSAGGVNSVLQRAAKKLEPQYDQLQAQVAASPVVYADETSWYVGAPGDWLWVFTTPQYTLFHVSGSRGGPVPEKILGPDFQGVVVSDCYSCYRRLKCPQHKCIAHHLRVLKQLLKRYEPKNTTYLLAWKQLWKDVVALHRARDGLESDAFDAQRSELETRFEALVKQEVTQRSDEKFQTRMRNLQEHRFGCLYHGNVDPTNNRAERALRPAVVQRKISCGNKTYRGAHVWEILVSLVVTAWQQGRDFVHELASELLPIPSLAR